MNITCLIKAMPSNLPPIESGMLEETASEDGWRKAVLVACRAVFGEAAHSFRGKFLHDLSSLSLPEFPRFLSCPHIISRGRSAPHVKSEFPTN